MLRDGLEVDQFSSDSMRSGQSSLVSSNQTMLIYLKFVPDRAKAVLVRLDPPY